MLKYKAFKFRIYPTRTQEIMLNKTFGSVRYLWNQNVALFNTYNSVTNPKPLYKSSTEYRNNNLWLKEVSAAAIQQKENDFKEFQKQFFNPKRKIKLGRPKFKIKGVNESFRLPKQCFRIYGNKIHLEKIGRVKTIFDRELPEGKFISITVSKNSSNQYWISISMETEIKKIPKTGKSIGIDVGLKTFYTTSENTKTDNPRYFRESQSKLKKYQKRLSRKKKDSRRYKKLKVAIIHQKIVNQRNWFLQTESTKLIKEFDSIYIEDLNIAGMKKNRKLSKSIFDASFSKFFSMLSYKADWYGKTLIKVPRFYPSSKTCSSCKAIKPSLLLWERQFYCESCGLTIDRDLNASLNIHSMGVDIELKRT